MQVEADKHYNYVNIFWTVSNKHDEFEVGAKLNQLTGKLHKYVSERNFLGRVPKFKFQYDTTANTVALVHTLIQKADCGPDFEPTDATRFAPPTRTLSDHEKAKPDLNINSRASLEKSIQLYNRTQNDGDGDAATPEYKVPTFEHPEDMNLNVYGIDYKGIMNKVLFHMKRARSQHTACPPVADPLPPAEWIAPAPFPAADESSTVQPTSERIDIMRKFIIENKKKRKRSAREARREKEIELMKLSLHIDEARERVHSQYAEQSD